MTTHKNNAPTANTQCTPFVGRKKELAGISSAISGLEGTSGKVILVAGEAGFGKSYLVREIQNLLDCQRPSCKALFGQCDARTGRESAFHVFDKIIRGSKGVGRYIFGFKKGIPALSAINPITNALMTFLSSVDDTGVAGGRELGKKIDEYERALMPVLSGSRTPVVIEDAHWIDDASTQLLLRLAARLETQPGLVIVTYRPSAVAENHPFFEARAELLSSPVCQEYNISGLTPAQISEYLQLRFGCELHPNFSAWLFSLCKGQPYYIKEYLNLLEQQGLISQADGSFVLAGEIERNHGRFELSGDLADFSVPLTIEALLKKRISALEENEIMLLKAASIQGESFGAELLALLPTHDHKEMEVMERLRKVSVRHRVIDQLRAGRLREEFSDFYQFEHYLMHQAFYADMTRGQKTRYHREYAKVLLEQMKGKKEHDYKDYLDIAFHYDGCGEYMQAGQEAFKAARMAFAEGALAECDRICDNVLTSLGKERTPQPEIDSIYTRTVLLKINSVWPADESSKKRLLVLITDAIDRCGTQSDNEVLAGLKNKLGSLYVALGNVPKAIEVMNESVDIARSTGNSLLLCSTMFHYGAELSKIDFEKGLQTRRQAYRLYQDELQDNIERDIHSDTVLSNLLVALGVGEFDAGNFARSINCLKEGIRILRENGLDKVNMLIAPATNYLSQVYIAAGQYDVAEDLLVAILEDDEIEAEPLDPWRGYNKTQLGKLYLEAGNFPQAYEYLVDGYMESIQTRQADLLTIATNFYGEFLMNPLHEWFDIEQAEKLLMANVGDCRQSGMIRSEVVSLSLLSRLKFATGIQADAESLGEQAIAILEKHGALPAVRVEEIYYYHAILMIEAGSTDKAMDYLGRAVEIVRKKASSLDPAHQSVFLENVPVNRLIRSASEKYMSDK